MSVINPLKAAGNDLVLVCGSFAPNGSSQPLASAFTNAAQFVSITRTGTGAFLIKFTDPYPQLVSKWCDIAASAVADLKAQWGVYAPMVLPSTPAQIALNILAVATPTDIAANAANRVSFGFIFRTTSWQQ